MLSTTLSSLTTRRCKGEKERHKRAKCSKTWSRGGYFKNGDSHLSPISHFSNTMWEMGCKFSWFPFLTSKFPFLIWEFQFLTSEFSLPTSHFWNPTSPFWFVVWTILFSSNLSQLEVGSGKWEMGSKKWEMGSKKWDVGIHNNLDILEWEMGPQEVGNGAQTRIKYITKNSKSFILI